MQGGGGGSTPTVTAWAVPVSIISGNSVTIQCSANLPFDPQPGLQQSIVAMSGWVNDPSATICPAVLYPTATTTYTVYVEFEVFVQDSWNGVEYYTQGSGSADVTVTVTNPTPTVLDLNNNNYCQIGSSYTISGTNLTGATAVSIGSVAAAFTVTSATAIQVTIPPMGGFNGRIVSVTTPYGTATITGYITQPSVVVTPNPANVSAGTARQFSASVSNLATTGITWGCSSGTIDSYGIWTAPTPTYNGQVYNIYATPTGNPASAVNVTVYVYYIASGLSITSNPAYPLYGGTFTLTPAWSNGSSATLTDIGAVSNGTTTGAITHNWGASKVYSLIVLNGAGTPTQLNKTIAAANVAVGAITGSSNQTVGYSQTFGGAVVTGAANTSVTWSSGGNGTWSGATWTAPGAGTYSITATSVAFTSAVSTAFTVYVVAMPSTSSLTSSKSPQTNGSSVTLTAVFAGGSGSISPTVGAVTSGSASGAFVPPAGTVTTYTLTVTNSAGQTASRTVDQTMVAAPVATSITAHTSNPLYGGTFYLTPVYSSGSASINQAYGTAPPSGDNTYDITQYWGYGTARYTLTVTNDAGTAASAYCDVTPQNVSVAAITGTTYQSVSTAQTFGGAGVSGAASTAKTWSCDSGTIVPSTGVFTAPATAQTVTITATANADGTTHQHFTVYVVALPTISSFTSSVGTNPAYNSAVTITPTFTVDANGSASITTIGSVSSGTAYAVQNANYTIPVYTLTVANGAGAVVTQTLTVVPKTVVGSISPAFVVVNCNLGISLTGTFSNGATNKMDWTCDAGLINGLSTAVRVDSGTAVTWTAPSYGSTSINIYAASVDDIRYAIGKVATARYIVAGKKSASASSV